MSPNTEAGFYIELLKAMQAELPLARPDNKPLVEWFINLSMERINGLTNATGEFWIIPDAEERIKTLREIVRKGWEDPRLMFYKPLMQEGSELSITRRAS